MEREYWHAAASPFSVSEPLPVKYHGSQGLAALAGMGLVGLTHLSIFGTDLMTLPGRQCEFTTADLHDHGIPLWL